MPSGARYTRPSSPYWPSMCRSFSGFCTNSLALSAKVGIKDLLRRCWARRERTIWGGILLIYRMPAAQHSHLSAASLLHRPVRFCTRGGRRKHPALLLDAILSERGGVCSLAELPASTPRRLYASCNRLSFFLASSLFAPVPAPAGRAAFSPVGASLPQVRCSDMPSSSDWLGLLLGPASALCSGV